MSDSSKRILVTAARSPIALHVARICHAAGHQVFTTEALLVHLCKFSNAVTKNYYAPSPRENPDKFIDRILEIVQTEKIDLIIPVYEEIIHLVRARDRFPEHCQILTSSFELLNTLHNKWLFNLKVNEFGRGGPETLLIQSEEALRTLNPNKTYALKPCYSRASLNVKKLTPGQPLPKLKFEQHNPWIAQEWIEGTQYCSYSVCNEGTITAHALYPYGYTADQKGCIVYQAIDHPEIFNWIKDFAAYTKFTGQIAFDFILTPDQKLYVIECNPRSTNGILLFDKEDGLDLALVDGSKDKVISPKIGTSKQWMTAMLIYGWRKSSIPNNSLKKFVEEFLKSKDTIFDSNDPLPFFGQPFITIEMLVSSLRHKLSLPAFFMYDYEWNGK